MAIVDRRSLPLSVSTHVTNHHEVTVVRLSSDFYMIEAKPTYDSDGLDEELRASGDRDDSPAQTQSQET